MQKDLIPKLSGIVKDTSFINRIINRVRNKQLFLVIALLDAENAFGEVHRSLIGETF